MIDRRRALGLGMAGLATALLPRAAFADPPRILASGLGFPEGPVALADGSVLFVEIARGRLSRAWPDGRVTVVADLGGGPNGCAIGPDKAAYIANDGGIAFRSTDGRTMVAGVPPTYIGGSIQRVDLETGAFRTLYDGLGGNRLKGPNDIVFDEWGGFWFTDTGKGYARSRDHGGLYWGKADGSELREIAYPLLTPNGISLGVDRRTLFVALSEKRQIVAYTLIGPGQVEMVNGAPKTRLVASLGGDMSIDNIAVEQSGNLVIAAVRQGAVLTVNPAGEVIETVKLPDPVVTAMAFGGPDMRTLFVTLSSTGQIAMLRWPRPGQKSVFGG
ncbi:gluconolactonase [Sphingomonas sp. YR710]|jgi:gluconolactonase|uniref:SMP-30/gluconolactonase/LRE family protein n=1 Tax=Sphingomonas sp. YR710 TaxID=1882773 RepID=UPI00088A565E|nr:SMP-30/gluconolactonase/LRE family protein [Sphingomonas sp. YR710]SDC82917.1 gluconolactonase [Sphingomonas sp. YR710]